MKSDFPLCVTADIQYLDGALSGLEIPAGFSVNVPNMRRALSVARWLGQIKRHGPAIRAAVSGSRYRVVGRIEIQGAL